MRKYLCDRVGREITDSEWKDCVDYFVEYAGFIEETLEEKGNGKRIKEGACLEVSVGDGDLEVWVDYSWIVEDGREFVLIGFDYGYVNCFEE
jgi:hypothetical protein